MVLLIEIPYFSKIFKNVKNSAGDEYLLAIMSLMFISLLNSDIKSQLKSEIETRL